MGIKLVQKNSIPRRKRCAASHMYGKSLYENKTLNKPWNTTMLTPKHLRDLAPQANSLIDSGIIPYWSIFVISIFVTSSSMKRNLSSTLFTFKARTSMMRTHIWSMDKFLSRIPCIHLIGNVRRVVSRPCFYGLLSNILIICKYMFSSFIKNCRLRWNRLKWRQEPNEPAMLTKSDEGLAYESWFQGVYY